MCKPPSPAPISHMGRATLFVALLLLVMIIAAVGGAEKRLAAVGLTCVTSTALLLSPEIVRALSSRRGWQRSPEQVAEHQKKVGRAIRWTIVAFVPTFGAMLALLFTDGWLADLGLLAGLLAIGVELVVLVINVVRWGFNGTFIEVSKEHDFESVVQRFLEAGNEARYAAAAATFGLGTVLQFVDAYRG
jgi:hypothetical protein